MYNDEDVYLTDITEACIGIFLYIGSSRVWLQADRYHVYDTR
jgi:hypothetical protein